MNDERVPGVRDHDNRDNEGTKPPDKPRKPGLLRGLIEGDFFEPLPEEELDAWEGRRSADPKGSERGLA